MIDLRSDIFIIPTTNDLSIVYSPLRGAAFYANSEATRIVKEYIESGGISIENKSTTVCDYLQTLSQIEVEEPQRRGKHSNSSDVMFILSQICNLECSYCYAQNSRSKEILSLEKIKTVVDSVCAVNDRDRKYFSFIGGGEPLATWVVFEWSVNYINAATASGGFSRSIRVVTNGTLLDEERISFLKQNGIAISISFDILPDVQDTQRPFPDRRISSFERVHDNIKMLLSNGLVPRLRSTITRRNVDLMPQMVEFVIENYPGIESLHFEPVTDMDHHYDDLYNAYPASFVKAMQISQEHGISLNNSIIASFKRIRTRFCHGEFCVTPSSDIVSCHRISSDKEDCFGAFKYGKVTNAIEIDTESLEHTLELFEEKSECCSRCFAKWHCAGGCTMYRAMSTEKEQLSYCKLVRSTLVSTLDRKLGSRMPIAWKVQDGLTPQRLMIWPDR